MLRIKQFIGKPIPGGHHYPIPGGPTVYAEEVDDLIDKIKAYRIQNGMPLGDPMAGLISYYAVHFPWAVEVGHRDSNEGNDKLTSEVYAWINSVWRSPPKRLMDHDITDPRAACCMRCPMRAHVKDRIDKLDDEMVRRAYLLSRGNLAPNELGWCAHHRWDNRLAVMIEKPCGRDSQPDGCWVPKP